MLIRTTILFKLIRIIYNILDFMPFLGFFWVFISLCNYCWTDYWFWHWWKTSPNLKFNWLFTADWKVNIAFFKDNWAVVNRISRLDLHKCWMTSSFEFIICLTRFIRFKWSVYLQTNLIVVNTRFWIQILNENLTWR